jgi:uncharacterized protein YecE (DUF72 family)
MAQIRIGTSGWHYKHWIGRYYPRDIKPAAMLDYYIHDFDSVELNNTFYQLPKEKSFDSWRSIGAWSAKLPAIYVYFDNDDSAYAVNNALTLKRLVNRRRDVAEPAATTAADCRTNAE